MRDGHSHWCGRSPSASLSTAPTPADRRRSCRIWSARRCSNDTACRPAYHGRRRRPHRLHQRDPGAVSRRSSGFSKTIRPTASEFTFVQIGAPSRTHIRRYQDLCAKSRRKPSASTDASGRRTGGRSCCLPRHHSHAEILPYYRTADVCLVTSLHDGMNLVAKEFVAARQDEQGVLILSRFAGASHELADALGGESVRHRGTGANASTARWKCRPRSAKCACSKCAPRARAQYLPLGRRPD